MKIHVTRATTLPIQSWEGPFVDTFVRRLNGDPDSRYEIVDDPEQAALIVMLESNLHKGPRQIERILADECVSRFPNRVFTINYEVAPAGFLPGLYTSLPAARMSRWRHRTWAYLFPANGKIFSTKEPFATTPRLLFSFRGYLSHPVRERMLAALEGHPRGAITRLEHFYDHSDEQQAEYVREILDTRFVLCPRGLAASSHRLFETMALGRCPIIVSDEWVPIDDIDWDCCSLRVSEDRLHTIVEMMERHEPRAAEMGRAAREVWKRLFSWHAGPRAALDRIVRILESRPADHDEREYQAAWSSRGFFELNGWPWPPE